MNKHHVYAISTKNLETLCVTLRFISAQSFQVGFNGYSES